MDCQPQRRFWTRIVDSLNPVGWLAWVYGKWFVGVHPTVGYALVCLISAGIGALLWTAAIDKHRDEHPPSPPKGDSVHETGATPPSPGVQAPKQDSVVQEKSRPPAVKTGDAAVPDSESKPPKSGVNRGNQTTSGNNSPAIIGNNNTVNIQPRSMEPMIEGLVLTFRQVPSPQSDAPYAIEVTVQTQSEVSPFTIGFVADKPLVGGKISLSGGGGVFHNYAQGFLNEAPDRSYWVGFDSPSVTPQRPLLVTLMSKEPFTLTKAVRVSR